MEAALAQAELARGLGEVPIGAVVTRRGEIISSAHNRRETGKNALLHAETEAIYKACERLGGWRLWECELYVTLEPCPMCAGAIVNARIPRVYFGAYEKKGGGVISKFNILSESGLNHVTDFEGGVLEEDCSAIIKKFFKDRR